MAGRQGHTSGQLEWIKADCSVERRGEGWHRRNEGNIDLIMVGRAQKTTQLKQDEGPYLQRIKLGAHQLIVEAAFMIRSLGPVNLRGLDAGRVLNIRYFGRPLHKSMASYVRLSYGHQGLMQMEESNASIDDQADVPNITI